MLRPKKKRPIVTLEQASDGKWIYKDDINGKYKEVDEDAIGKYPWFKKWIGR